MPEGPGAGLVRKLSSLPSPFFCNGSGTAHHQSMHTPCSPDCHAASHFCLLYRWQSLCGGHAQGHALIALCRRDERA